MDVLLDKRTQASLCPERASVSYVKIVGANSAGGSRPIGRGGDRGARHDVSSLADYLQEVRSEVWVRYPELIIDALRARPE